jgi:COMPASS component SWD3
MTRHALAIAGLALAATSSACEDAAAPGLTQGPTLSAHLQHTFTGHSDVPRQVAFSPDGQWLASSSDDKTVKVWRLESTAAASETLGMNWGRVREQRRA